MTNTRFNNLWDYLKKEKYVEFTNRGEKLMLSAHPHGYGEEYSLEIISGNRINTVSVHWSKEHFRYLLVD